MLINKSELAVKKKILLRWTVMSFLSLDFKFVYIVFTAVLPHDYDEVHHLYTYRMKFL